MNDIFIEKKAFWPGEYVPNHRQIVLCNNDYLVQYDNYNKFYTLFFQLKNGQYNSKNTNFVKHNYMTVNESSHMINTSTLTYMEFIDCSFDVLYRQLRNVIWTKFTIVINNKFTLEKDKLCFVLGIYIEVLKNLVFSESSQTNHILNVSKKLINDLTDYYYRENLLKLNDIQYIIDSAYHNYHTIEKI